MNMTILRGLYCDVFTLTVTDTETETDKMDTEPDRDLCWYLVSMQYKHFHTKAIFSDSVNTPISCTEMDLMKRSGKRFYTSMKNAKFEK